MNRRAAFTLTEVMVSLAVLGLVTVFLTDMLVLQTRTYQVVDQLAEAQTNLRVITDLAERDMRVSGFMVPEAAAVCGVDLTGAPDILVVSDPAPVNPASQIRNDLGASITAGYDGGGTDTLTLLGTSTIDGVAFYDSNGDGVADTDFLDVPGLGQTGAIIVVDRNNPTRGTSCGRIVTGSLTIGAVTSTVVVDYDFNTLNASQPLRAVVAGDNPVDLVAIPGHVYQVNGQSQLLRNGVILAEEVEDMQFALFFDLDDDGIVDGDPAPAPQVPPFTSDTEYPGSILGGTQYQSNQWDHSTLREIRLSFAIRTRAQDQQARENPALATSTFIAMENRVAPVQAADGFRRRLLTMTVQPRNLGRRES
jgi:prepilin-type N-terminal cleavage/methylation domain-containing protein